MSNLFQDIRYALRQFFKSPTFALTALLTLAVGIGANVVVFGVLNALLLNPLPVPHLERVFTVEHVSRNNPLNSSFPQYRDLRDRNSVFADLAAARIMRIGLDANGAAQPVWGYEVTGNYFRMMDVRPVLGRFLEVSDEKGDHANEVAVLSYSCWKSRFDGNASIVGQTVRINKHPYTVIGVAPAGFQGTEKMFWPEVWMPMLNEAQIEGYDWLSGRNNQNSWVIGRLKAGVSPAQAEADLDRIGQQLSKQYPNTDERMSFHLSRPGFLGDMLGGPVRGFMYGVMLLATLVLLAACTNLGGLLAARTSDRARELAFRVAIGSSRGRILRQLIVESIVVAVCGGALAMLVAAALLSAISNWRPIADFPVQFLVQPDKRLYAFALLISVSTGLIFGCMPVRQIWKTDPNQVLRSGSTQMGQRRFAFRDMLLGVQIAVCCLLVTACFVALRGLEGALRTPLGFEPRGATLAVFDLHLAGYSDAEVPAIQKQLLDTVSHLPGVTAAGLSNSTPLALDQSSTSVFSAGETEFRASTRKFNASYYQVLPGYFVAAGTRMLVGRDFTLHDDKSSPKVAIVNAVFARKLFGTENALGKLFHSHGSKPWEIVGIVEDGKYETLVEDQRPAIFYPILQMPNTSTTLVVRSIAPASQVIPAIHTAINQVDRSIPIFALNAWQDSLGFMMLPTIAATVALSVFGSLAIVLALAGLFGMASYSVSKRLRELGIRVALGAQQMQVLQAALSRTAILLAIGSIAGLLLGVAASRLLASIVYHASASDPLVLLGVALTMVLVGIVSASIPARRALAIHPMELLRE